MTNWQIPDITPTAWAKAIKRNPIPNSKPPEKEHRRHRCMIYDIYEIRQSSGNPKALARDAYVQLAKVEYLILRSAANWAPLPPLRSNSSRIASRLARLVHTLPKQSVLRNSVAVSCPVVVIDVIATKTTTSTNPCARCARCDAYYLVFISDFWTPLLFSLSLLCNKPYFPFIILIFF
jgi:hypothetical protein